MKKKNRKELRNGLTSLATSMANEQIFPDIPAMPLGINPTLGTAPIQSANPMFYNNRYYMITNMRTLLNEMYIEHGIIQTMIDQPVEDGFRGGFKIISSELSNDEIIELEKKIEETEAVEKIPLKVMDRREGDPASLIADNTKAKNILDWTTEKTLKDSIKSAYSWEKDKNKH